MGVINGNNNQVTINIEDIIPPENIATVDKNGVVGNTYTKAQFDQSFNEKSEEIDTKIENIQQLVESEFKGPLNPSDTAPTEDGSYKPEISSEDDKPSDPNSTSDWGKVYANAGNLRAKSGYETMFYKKGSVWKKSESKIPGVDVAPTFDPDNTNDAQGGKQIAEYFSTVQHISTAPVEVTTRISGFINDSAQLVTSIPGYTSTNIIDVTNVDVVSIENLTPPTNDYSVKFFDVSNNLVLDHRQKGTYQVTKPLNAVKFAVSYADFTNTFKVYITHTGGVADRGTSSTVNRDSSNIKYKPVNSVGVAQYFESEISQFAGELNIEGFYETNIKALKISIDDFSGTDDERIEKATAMIENVGGGQIYFPSRQINITKAILIPSNTRFILDNCQIQMADNIHDNIFRSKGVKINSSSPNGVQTEAYWTENFEIIGVGMPTIRQSVTPLHTGDFYGWRGVSVLFARCRNYKLKNIKVIESHMWSISNEYSERGYFENLEFANTLHANADGLNFRNGCRNMYAKTLRGITNDNAVATTILDSTIQSTPSPGYSYQCLGWTFGDYWGAENIIVEDVQVRSKYGSGLILGTSRLVKNITYKDFVSTVASGSDWDNVSVCGNSYRTFIYGTSYIDGNVRNINIINSATSVHEYSLGVYGGQIYALFANRISNTNPSKLGDIKNDTGTILNSSIIPFKVTVLGDSTMAAFACRSNSIAEKLFTTQEIAEGKTALSIAASGNTYAQQLSAWNALTVNQRRSAEYIILGGGFNDCVGPSSTAAITSLQNLINKINTDKNPAAKLVLNALFPCKARWQYINDQGIGTVDLVLCQQIWTELNQAILGNSTNPAHNITGVDYRNNYHVSLMDDGSGNLKSIYDCGDKIHENQSGADVIIQGIRNIIL